MAAQNELRCACAHRTLLAKVARDPESGAPCLHIKALKKGARAPFEMLLLSGTAKIRCRDCLRWFQVGVRREKIEFRVTRDDIDCERDLEPSTVAPNRYGNGSSPPRGT